MQCPESRTGENAPSSDAGRWRDSIKLLVQDSGVGLGSRGIDKLFEAFTRPKRMAWASVWRSAVRSSRVIRESCGRWQDGPRARTFGFRILAPPDRSRAMRRAGEVHNEETTRSFSSYCRRRRRAAVLSRGIDDADGRLRVPSVAALVELRQGVERLVPGQAARIGFLAATGAFPTPTVTFLERYDEVRLSATPSDRSGRYAAAGLPVLRTAIFHSAVGGVISRILAIESEEKKRWS